MSDSMLTLIPEEGLNLVQFSGKELLEKLGNDIISNVVLGVLSGENIRSLTEGLTQRRILLMNASAFVTHLRSLKSFDNFEKNINKIISKELESGGRRLKNDEKIYLYWMLGLTKKGIENVTRGSEGISEYLDLMEKNLAGISNEVASLYGDIDINIHIGNDSDISMNWPTLLRCFLTMSAQTLTIRGSEKSVYGKLFEKFVLGSALTIMGADYINRNDTSRDRMVFWLSSNDKRESDATLLIRPGYGISFDIGFIGRGNPEIVMDKLTRFESRMERGGRRNLMSTIVLIDTLGENSTATRIAYEMGAHIIQMSDSYWIHELAHVIKEEHPTFDHPLLSMTKEQSISYLAETIKKVDLSAFLSAIEMDSE